MPRKVAVSTLNASTLDMRVQYPVTIQKEDLARAFLSIEGLQDLIARVVDSAYTASYLKEE